MAQLEPEHESHAAPQSPETRAHDADPAANADPAFRPPPDEPSTSAEEYELWTGRTSWKHFTTRLLLWLFGNIAAATGIIWIAGQTARFESKHAFWAIVAILVLSGFAIPARIVLRILGERYRLTSQRLFIARGIVSQTIDQTELVRVDDVRIHKTLVDRLFGLGTVAIVSTDATDRETAIVGVADAEGIAEAIRSHVRAMRRKSLYVESL